MFKEGIDIRVSLLKNGKTQKWLIDELIKSGVSTSKTELSRVLSGNRSGPKADKILTKAHDILRKECR